MSYDLDLSIIIINWRSLGYLRPCLASIYANTQGVKFEIIVVDNASFDGCGEMLRSLFPEVHFLQSEKNLGFSQANNLASLTAKGRNILFLNPDTEIIGSAIPVMMSSLESLNDAGIVGCKLLNSDHTVQMSCIQRFPSIWNQVLDADYFHKLIPQLMFWTIRPLISKSAVMVDVISGACLMIRRDVFDRVGQFTVSYFMYSEDVDLCYKVRQGGMKNYYDGNATVIHHGGGSSGSKQDHFTAVMMKQSRLIFFRNRHSRFYAFVYRLCMASAAISRITILIVILLLTIGKFRRHRLCFALGKWAKIFRWSIGLETWAKIPN
jgi:N-acetylglucosaminyl-diphospho-decaprenol L-rhamnosyltransferase